MDGKERQNVGRPYPEEIEEYQRRMQQFPQQQIMVQGYAVPPPYWGPIPHQYPHPPPYGYQFPPMDGVPLPPGIPGLGGSTDPLEAVLGPFPCVRLRALPYDAGLEDILILFQGLVVIDVVQMGNGGAYVIFANPMDFQMALQRDRQPIGRQLVEISAASREHYYAAIAKQHMEEQEETRPVARSVGVAAMGATEGMGDEQKQTAPGASVLWGGTTGSPPGGMIPPPLGPSYVEPRVQTQPQPVAPPTQQPPQGAPLHQTAATNIAAPAARGTSGSSRGGLHAPLQKRTGGGIQVGEHTGFLRMRGLPFSSTKDDIYTFFEGYNPVQESIVLTYRNDGRATGEAYVGFASPEDSKRAMELHRRMMGSRYIELFISNKDEQGRALARFGNR